MHYASHIQVLINPKEKQFAIRACKEEAPNAVAFSKPEGEQKYQIKISASSVVDMIRKMANWNAADNWNIPGIYFADENTKNKTYHLGYFYEFETNTYFLKSRYYNPELCRFISADGIVNANQDILGNNLFAYCSNDPVTYFIRVSKTGSSSGVMRIELGANESSASNYTFNY